MERRTKTILITAAVLVVIGVLAFVLRPRRVGAPGPAAVVPAAGAPETSSLTRSGGAPEIPAASALPSVPTRLALQQLAMTFAERFGSFSSEGNYVNVADLAPVLTERYRRALAANVRPPRVPTTYQASRTTAVRAEVTLPEGEASARATARVTVQHVEIQTNGTSRSTPRALTVRLVRTTAGWLVDGAEWEPVSR